jgi:uncharacterized protein (DUF2336 family)
MNAHQSLMDELENAVRHGSREERMETLRRLTDLFLIAPQQLADEQIALFDDVLTHMIARVETRARAELARRLAPIDQAPNEVIRQLAYDEEIAVASPILSESTRITTADLVRIAEHKSPAHLLAIAGRSVVEQQVTDVLVTRGDRDVVHKLAANAGASFSEAGYSKLARRAEADEGHNATLGRRLDIPLRLFRALLLKASEAVRNRLISTLGPERQELVRQVIAEVSDKVAHEAPAARNLEDAQRLISMLKETGRLNEAEVLTFARRGKFDEVIASLAALCGVSFDLVERLTRSDRADSLLVPCKAIDFDWTTVEAILQARNVEGLPQQDMENAAREYRKLSVSTAGRVLRFWQVRQAAQARPNTTMGEQIPAE